MTTNTFGQKFRGIKRKEDEELIPYEKRTKAELIEIIDRDGQEIWALLAGEQDLRSQLLTYEARVIELELALDERNVALDITVEELEDQRKRYEQFVFRVRREARR